MNALRGTLATVTLAIGLLSSGCMSSGQASKLAQQVAAPGWEMAEAGDLSYCVAAFHRKNGRWPGDYSELSGFIERSDGYLVLMREYEKVEFARSGGDGLVISYRVGGTAHRIEFAPTQVARTQMAPREKAPRAAAAAALRPGMTFAQADEIMRGSRHEAIVKNGEETVVKYSSGDYVVFVNDRLKRCYRHGESRGH